MYGSIKDNYLKFKWDTPYLNLVFKHLKNLVPDYQERWGSVRKVWKKVGKDDLAHAINFLLVGAKILFPGDQLHEGKIIPQDYHDEPLLGSQEWCLEDFEKQIRKLSNPTGTIIIPPKK